MAAGARPNTPTSSTTPSLDQGSNLLDLQKQVNKLTKTVMGLTSSSSKDDTAEEEEDSGCGAQNSYTPVKQYKEVDMSNYVRRDQIPCWGCYIADKPQPPIIP
jgi:hypothetical protein